MMGNALRCILAASAFGLIAPAWPGDGNYSSKAFNPAHKLELQRGIQECARKVAAASDNESRSKCQEELCKKLLQAQDYENALHVATAIYQTPDINAERRAAHHFMIAQIYAFRMEASPNLTLMEQNRRAAVSAAQQVVEQNYPEKWFITQAAQNLRNRLQDPNAMRETEAWVRKRQLGHSDPQMIAAARAQASSVENSVGQSGGSGRSFGLMKALSRVKIGPSTSKVAAEPANQAVAARQAAQSGSLGSGSSKIHFSDGTRVSFSPSSDASVKNSAYVNRRVGISKPVLQSPIIIDGTAVRHADRIGEVDLQQIGRPWPKSNGTPVDSAYSTTYASSPEAASAQAASSSERAQRGPARK